jgi:ribosome-binding factor A
VTRRTERVGEEIRAELSRLLREETSDPRIELATLTRVDLSPDFRNAKVHWSSPAVDSGERERVPQLDFRYDPSLALATTTLELLREVNDDGAGRSVGSDDAPQPEVTGDGSK